MLVDIRLIFANTNKRLDIPPQLKKLVIKEVVVITPGCAGKGSVYEHIAKYSLDYNNPITTVFHIDSKNPQMYFGSKNGQVSFIADNYQYVANFINPQDSVISKIIVKHQRNWISGMQFLNKDNKCVLEAG